MRWTLHNATKALAALLVLSGCLVSCGKDDPATASEAPEMVLKTNPAAKTAGSQFVTITSDGPWTLSMTYEGEQSGWASLSKTSGEVTSGDILLKYSANTDDDSRTLVLTASNSAGSVEVKFTQKGTSEVRKNQGVSSTKAGWLELPATDASDGFDFFTHNMEISGKTVRNYSFYWDYDNLVAPWVAYPLYKACIGSSGRSDAWGVDPLLADEEQPVLVRGFSAGNDGWRARGHQIPSADRTASYKVNVPTFYGTNMTPQDNDFNGGPWLVLENKVRSWAQETSTDTLYVVTGCVTTGSSKYCLDNYSKHVTIPTAYFKAVLRHDKTNSVGYSGYSGCAFYMTHSGSAASPSKSNALSINELEEKLGYELFVNLPNVVGEENAAKIKAQKPSTVSWWW